MWIVENVLFMSLKVILLTLWVVSILSVWIYFRIWVSVSLSSFATNNSHCVPLSFSACEPILLHRKVVAQNPMYGTIQCNIFALLQNLRCLNSKKRTWKYHLSESNGRFSRECNSFRSIFTFISPNTLDRISYENTFIFLFEMR